MDKYNCKCEARITQKQKEQLEKNAAASGMKLSAYVRSCIEGKEVMAKDNYLVLKELINEINKIGININQIAKTFNSGFFSESEKRKLFALMKKLNEFAENFNKKEGK